MPPQNALGIPPIDMTGRPCRGILIFDLSNAHSFVPSDILDIGLYAYKALTPIQGLKAINPAEELRARLQKYTSYSNEKNYQRKLKKISVYNDSILR